MDSILHTLPIKATLRMNIKVLFLLTQDIESPSGLGRYAPLARELSKRNFQVTVAALHSSYSTLSQRRYWDQGVQIWYVAPMHVRKLANDKTYYSPLVLLLVVIRAFFSFLFAALIVPTDVIVIGKPHPMNSLAALMVKMIRPKIKLFLDCDDYEAGSSHFTSSWQQGVVAFFEDRVPLWVDYVTTHTDFMFQRLLALGVPARKLLYLSNGIERQRFTPPNPFAGQQLRSKLGLDGKKVVLFVGSLSLSSHPVDLLIRAFSLVLDKEPLARLLLVGGGDDYDYLKIEVNKKDLSHAVVMTGRIPPDEVVNYYYLGDVSVDPIYDDGAARGRSPLKLFESWACGIPFITVDVGDRKRLLGTPQAGLLVAHSNPGELAEGILQVLHSPEFAEEIRKRGLQRVEAYYWDHLADDYEKIILSQFDN